MKRSRAQLSAEETNKTEEDKVEFKSRSRVGLGERMALEAAKGSKEPPQTCVSVSTKDLRQGMPIDVALQCPEKLWWWQAGVILKVSDTELWISVRPTWSTSSSVIVRIRRDSLQLAPAKTYVDADRGFCTED